MFVAVRTITKPHSLQKNITFKRQIEEECDRTGHSRDGTGYEEVLQRWITSGGGTQADWHENAGEEILVCTKARSSNVPKARSESSNPFWFLHACSALTKFKADEPDLYCPAYDLCCSELEFRQLGLKNERFTCPREQYWEYYKSVLVLPIRAVAYTNEPGLLGFLWIDSKQPRAFRATFETVNENGLGIEEDKSQNWPPYLSLVNAVSDAIAVILLAEDHFDKMTLRDRRSKRASNYSQKAALAQVFNEQRQSDGSKIEASGSGLSEGLPEDKNNIIDDSLRSNGSEASKICRDIGDTSHGKNG